jgi:hypothetical protein
MDLNNCPGIFIPCENLEATKELIKIMYEKGILKDESFKLVKVPNGFLNELNNWIKK